jgi:NAD(P)H-quinone oxidoreductase subunit 5
MTPPSLPPASKESLALAVPAVLATGALVAARFPRLARAAPLTATLLAIAGATAFALGGAPAHPHLSRLIVVDPVSATLSLLVCGLGWVVARYAERGLDSHERARFQRWLLATLAGVVLVIGSASLLVAGVAWMATSLCLHPLLTFHPERRGAVVAAHKKFVVSRAAELCLGLALVLIARATGTLHVADLAAWAERGTLSGGVELGLVLVVVAVALKTAQAPFHGWLTQVVDAPTPVSALLHAGVVNLGGVLLLKLMPLLSLAPSARLLLLGFGLITVVVASFARLGQHSVKVSLAWSTSAQLGFMLAECALGMTSMALLHIVGHSLYKAHAFLLSGSAVYELRVLNAVGGAARARSRTALAMLLRVVVALGVYLALHDALHGVLEEPSASPVWLGLTAAVLLLVLAGEQWLVHARQSPLAFTLLPTLSAGFYLDDLLSRALFRLWPPPLAEQHRRAIIEPSPENQEA